MAALKAVLGFVLLLHLVTSLPIARNSRKDKGRALPTVISAYSNVGIANRNSKTTDIPASEEPKPAVEAAAAAASIETHAKESVADVQSQSIVNPVENAKETQETKVAEPEIEKPTKEDKVAIEENRPEAEKTKVSDQQEQVAPVSDESKESRPVQVAVAQSASAPEEKKSTEENDNTVHEPAKMETASQEKTEPAAGSVEQSADPAIKSREELSELGQVSNQPVESKPDALVHSVQDAKPEEPSPAVEEKKDQEIVKAASPVEKAEDQSPTGTAAEPEAAHVEAVVAAEPANKAEDPAPLPIEPVAAHPAAENIAEPAAIQEEKKVEEPAAAAEEQKIAEPAAAAAVAEDHKIAEPAAAAVAEDHKIAKPTAAEEQKIAEPAAVEEQKIAELLTAAEVVQEETKAQLAAEASGSDSEKKAEPAAEASGSDSEKKAEPAAEASASDSEKKADISVSDSEKKVEPAADASVSDSEKKTEVAVDSKPEEEAVVKTQEISAEIKPEQSESAVNPVQPSDEVKAEIIHDPVSKLEIKPESLIEEDRSFKGHDAINLSAALEQHSLPETTEDKKNHDMSHDDVKSLRENSDEQENEGIRSEREEKRSEEKKDKDKDKEKEREREKEREKEKLLSKPIKETKPFKPQKIVINDDPAREYDEPTRRRRSDEMNPQEKETAPAKESAVPEKILVDTVKEEEPVQPEILSLVPDNYPVVLPNGVSTLSDKVKDIIS